MSRTYYQELAHEKFDVGLNATDFIWSGVERLAWSTADPPQEFRLWNDRRHEPNQTCTSYISFMSPQPIPAFDSFVFGSTE